MVDMLNDGQAWVAGQLRDFAGQPITYKRGSLSVDLVATRGRTETDAWTADGQDQIVHSRSDDFIFKPELLVLGGVQADPKIDDRIVCPQGEFRVLPIEGDRCWRNSGAYGHLIRVHTKRIGD